eukprot:TRINITY_DN10564_c0_g1_i1.p1 TRINITY_DN10564_c0_g1~~TRINITY_DN10564_c0_g1_i1.p1  ORF type:complete len:972 (+),score=283.17 TRINITY_DN10564_c0_g1_i1:110-3025(+)
MAPTARIKHLWERLRIAVLRGEVESALEASSAAGFRRRRRRSFDDDLRWMRIRVPVGDRPRKDGVVNLPAAVLQWKKTQPPVFTDARSASGRQSLSSSVKQPSPSNQRAVKSPRSPGAAMLSGAADVVTSLHGQTVAKELCQACAESLDKAAPKALGNGMKASQEFLLRTVLHKVAGFSLTGALRITTEQALRLCVLLQVSKQFSGYGEGDGSFAACCAELAKGFDASKADLEEETAFVLWADQHPAQVGELRRTVPRVRELLHAKQAVVAKAATAAKDKEEGKQLIRECEKRLAAAKQRAAGADAKLLQLKAFSGDGDRTAVAEAEREKEDATEELRREEYELERLQGWYKSVGDLSREQMEVVRGAKAGARAAAERRAREEAEKRRRERLTVSRRMWARLGTAQRTGELKFIGAHSASRDKEDATPTNKLASLRRLPASADAQSEASSPRHSVSLSPTAASSSPSRVPSASALPQPTRSPSIAAPSAAKPAATAPAGEAKAAGVSPAADTREQLTRKQQEASSQARSETVLDEEAAIAGAMAERGGEDAGKAETINLGFGTYVGSVKSGKLHGRGRVTWADTGDEYDGYWRDSRRHGKGTMTRQATGVVYTGDWMDNAMHGQGVLRDPRVGTYVGHFANGLEDGRGNFTFLNGSVYKGGFVAGLFHGWGVYTDAEGNVYEGQWREGLQWGQGTLTGVNSHVYVGDWVRDEKHGKGQYRCSEYTYDGDWNHGFMEGQGTLSFAAGASYVGQFCQDKEHGRGVYQHKDGYKYDGHFQMGKRHGTGVETSAGGDRYEGCFVDGLKHGRGKLTFASGSVYDGGWRRDKMHGHAVYTYAERMGGKRFQVEYEDGKCVAKTQLAAGEEPSIDIPEAAIVTSPSASPGPQAGFSPSATPTADPPAAAEPDEQGWPPWLPPDIEDDEKQLLLARVSDEAAFAALTGDDLKELGLKFGPRKKVSSAVDAARARLASAA